LAKSASKVDRNHADWQLNNADLWVNHSYGFGLINARNAIDLAKNWKNYPALETVEVGREVNSPIPDGSDVGLRSVINIEDNFNIEFIDVFFDAPDHERLGDLEINLYSPSGTVSQLAELHHSSFSGFFAIIIGDLDQCVI
jgi:hypothetical protein